MKRIGGFDRNRAIVKEWEKQQQESPISISRF